MENRTAGGKLQVPEIALGCMRIDALSEEEVEVLIHTAVEAGAGFFEHADIYGDGASEEIFGQAFVASGIPREDVLLQSKCGIRKDVNTFDFSKEHILRSVDGILKRLRTDYLDVLLLHRPDALVEPEEVAAAFDELYRSGKVRNFGVSNQSPWLVEFLQHSLDQKLIFNQLQLSPAHTLMIDQQMQFNMVTDAAVNRTSEVLEYCRLRDIMIQVWSPFQFGFFEGTYLGHENYKELNETLERIAAEKSVTSAAVVTAWLLRHPARMQVILGTTKPQRLRECCRGSEITLSREEWYQIYTSAGNLLP